MPALRPCREPSFDATLPRTPAALRLDFRLPPCPSPTHFPFDPSYGYSLAELLAVEPPPEPAGFAPFWRARYRHALSVVPGVRLQASTVALPGFRVQDLEYQSTDAFPIRGWLLTPLSGPPRQALVLGHGYGGI